jgi:hypothetical protein
MPRPKVGAFLLQIGPGLKQLVRKPFGRVAERATSSKPFLPKKFSDQCQQYNGVKVLNRHPFLQHAEHASHVPYIYRNDHATMVNTLCTRIDTKHL